MTPEPIDDAVLSFTLERDSCSACGGRAMLREDDISLHHICRNCGRYSTLIKADGRYTLERGRWRQEEGA